MIIRPSIIIYCRRTYGQKHYILFVPLSSEESRRSTDTVENTLHSVRPDISRRSKNTVENTLYSVHPDIFRLIKPFIPFLTRVAMKGWSDPPSHRLPVHNELQTDLKSLRRPPAARSSGEETWGENPLFAPASPSRRRETHKTRTPPPPSSEFNNLK